MACKPTILMLKGVFCCCYLKQFLFETRLDFLNQKKCKVFFTSYKTYNSNSKFT